MTVLTARQNMRIDCEEGQHMLCMCGCWPTTATVSSKLKSVDSRWPGKGQSWPAPSPPFSAEVVVASVKFEPGQTFRGGLRPRLA